MNRGNDFGTTDFIAHYCTSLEYVRFRHLPVYDNMIFRTSFLETLSTPRVYFNTKGALLESEFRNKCICEVRKSFLSAYGAGKKIMYTFVQTVNSSVQVKYHKTSVEQL